MINKTIIILISLLLGASCNKKPKNNLDSDYYKKGIFFLEHVDNFEKNNNLFLARYGLNLNGTIETPDWNDIHQFEVTFCCIEKLNLIQTRKKLLHCIHEYLKLINSNNELKPYLYRVPFTNKELFFRIAFYEETGKRVTNGSIALCHLDEDTIYYLIAHDDESLEFIHKESYKEALKTVQKQESNNE